MKTSPQTRWRKNLPTDADVWGEVGHYFGTQLLVIDLNLVEAGPFLQVLLKDCIAQPPAKSRCLVSNLLTLRTIICFASVLHSRFSIFFFC